MNCDVINIQAGDCYVTDENEVITTVLGSCIAACIRDKRICMGGMNHFMLPAASDTFESADLSYGMRYGTYAMEYLINEILRRGGRRETLEVKLFGGASVMATLSDIGRRNIEFVRDFLRTEGYHVVSEDLGDVFPRRVKYFPTTGRAMVKRMQPAVVREIADLEQAHMQSIRAEEQPVKADIELF
jgi:chemotaxis protein CheD